MALRFGRHVDSAQAYRNEDQVGLAIKKSGLERGELFISAYLRMQYSIQGADTLPYIFLLYLQINTSWQRLNVSAGIMDTKALWKESRDPWRNFFPANYKRLPTSILTFSWFTTQCLGRKNVWRRTKRFKSVRALDKSEASVYRTSIYFFSDCIPRRQFSRNSSSSGIRHLEEIKTAGYDMPSVNQIEVRYPPICLEQNSDKNIYNPRSFTPCVNRDLLSTTVEHILS